jgi:hypothetical protein
MKPTDRDTEVAGSMSWTSTNRPQAIAEYRAEVELTARTDERERVLDACETAFKAAGYSWPRVQQIIRDVRLGLLQ